MLVVRVFHESFGRTDLSCLLMLLVCSTVLVVDSLKNKNRNKQTKRLDMEEVELYTLLVGM